MFIFQVLDKDQNIVNEIVLSQGESKTIKLNYGEYKVLEKNNWSWRYDGEFTKDISLNNNSNKTSVTYENTRSILKWFDFMGKKENNY